MDKKERKVILRLTETISAGHYLTLPYKSKCSTQHGHNWRIEVSLECSANKLTDYGMVIDFSELKQVIRSLDHKNLNEVLPQPTAENMGLYLVDIITKRLLEINPSAKVVQVRVVESEGSEVTITCE